MFETKSTQVFNFGARSEISNIMFLINDKYHIYIYDLLWVPNLIALGIYFIFGVQIFLKLEIDTCFNVECVLLGLNFILLVVTAR